MPIKSLSNNNNNNIYPSIHPHLSIYLSIRSFTRTCAPRISIYCSAEHFISGIPPARARCALCAGASLNRYMVLTQRYGWYCFSQSNLMWRVQLITFWFHEEHPPPFPLLFLHTQGGMTVNFRGSEQGAWITVSRGSTFACSICVGVGVVIL